MCTDDTNDVSTNGAGEPADDTPQPVAESQAKPGWNRRTFLKAAALGTAAAALVGKGRDGLQLGPLSALADTTGTDLLFSGFQCTAGDITLISARALNEPCGCTPGTSVPLTVEFTLKNSATSARSCIVLHLCPATYTVGGQTFTFDPDDIVLPGVIQDQETKTYQAVIQNYPCGVGILCFGPVVAPKGRCTGCCTTISYNVPGDRGDENCPNPTPTSSKCKHQQICIVGRGSTTLDCDTSAGGVQTDCPVPCGSTTTLRLCTTSPAALGPFTFTLGAQSFGPTTDTCHDFTVGPITANTTFTGTVTDSTGCTAASNSVTVRTAAITPQISVDSANCNGVLSISTAVPGFSGCSFAYTIDGVAAANTETDTKIVRVNADGTLSYRNLDNTCHTIGVTATCGACSGSASTTVKQACVATTTGCTP